MQLRHARAVLSAVEDQARELSVRVCAAVLDAGGNPVATIRMDGAQLGAYQLSLDKAWTAVAFESPTEEWASVTAPGAPAWGFGTSLAGRVIVFGGGVPLVEADRLVGGVGVSGSSAEIDARCARAGAAALPTPGHRTDRQAD
jgi:uncharacterized protein GlcG (DUF336 family)